MRYPLHPMKPGKTRKPSQNPPQTLPGTFPPNPPKTLPLLGTLPPNPPKTIKKPSKWGAAFGRPPMGRDLGGFGEGLGGGCPGGGGFGEGLGGGRPGGFLEGLGRVFRSSLVFQDLAGPGCPNPTVPEQNVAPPGCAGPDTKI